MPLKPGEAPPGKARLAIPLLGLAQSRLGAEPRFGQRSRDGSRPARKTKDAAPEPRKPQGPGGTAGRAWTEEPGPALADPGGSRLRLRPWPLPPAGSGLPLYCLALRETLSVRRGLAAAINLGAGPSFPLHARVLPVVDPASLPHQMPRSPGQGLGAPRLRRESSQKLPLSPERGNGPVHLMPPSSIPAVTGP